MPVVTRFAPSPTGFLHIGGARTALFNWLFAKHHGGQFLLRIEDTDRVRSTREAVDAIYDGLSWLGLDWDGEAVLQSERAGRHRAAAHRLLESGSAYRCWATVDELAAMRERARAEGRPFRYDGRWRDRDPAEAPSGVAPVIRLRAPVDGKTVVHDLVQGDVEVANAQLDDMILLRGDGTPTYMLAVVVDDHDMGVTHVIRGDDHLSNAFRQYQLYRALGWEVPAFAHVPLIHGPDGAKLSKRHGALGVDAYREMGYLPEAMCNYLLRLGWSHGDDEVIDREHAIEWFDLAAVGRSAARFDFAKLGNLNGVWIRRTGLDRLAGLLEPLVEQRLGHPLAAEARARVHSGLGSLRDRARTLPELADGAMIYARDVGQPIRPEAAALLTPGATGHLQALRPVIAALPAWTADELEKTVRSYVETGEAPRPRLRDVAQPLRVAMTGATVSPPVFEVMAVLGRDLGLARLDFSLKHVAATESTAEVPS